MLEKNNGSIILVEVDNEMQLYTYTCSNYLEIYSSRLCDLFPLVEGIFRAYSLVHRPLSGLQEYTGLYFCDLMINHPPESVSGGGDIYICLTTHT